jgi:hypothetical protein
MKRTALVVGLSLALAAPVALAAPPTTTGPATPAAGKPETKPVAPQAKGKAKTLYLIRACVTANTEGAVSAKVLSANAHARKYGAKRNASLTPNLNGTKVILVGKARPNTTPKPKGPVKGEVSDLTQGDVITLRVRATRGTKVAELGAFASVVDNGPIRPKVCPTTDPTNGPTAPAATT